MVKKKKYKYDYWIGDNSYRAHKIEDTPDSIDSDNQMRRRFEHDFPPEMLRSISVDSGFFFGRPNKEDYGLYVGCPSKVEGNYIIVGGCGSGKSSGIFMPTLRTFDGAICATDVKGELSELYRELFCLGLVDRPGIIFNPMQLDGPSYDPFDWLLQDERTRLVSNIWEIALAIIPILLNDNQPFWAETERAVFAAALLHYFKLGLSFSEAVTQIMSRPISALCQKLIDSGDIEVNIFLGNVVCMKPEVIANVDRGLRNKLMLFVADPYISHAFRGRREGANCFTWEDLDTHNIFLRIPADKIEEWSGAVNLMYTQLMRHLERRPEMYSTDGATNIQTLLMMDEFARFGKLEMITAAMATLRSKNVNICLAVQSVAQLDKIYGEHDRRIIFDNCPFQVILRANDADTQKYLCEMIGTRMRTQHSTSEHSDDCMDITGYSKQRSETRELIVQPHELATLQDVLLLTPFGFYRAEKFQMQNEDMRSLLFSNSSSQEVTEHETADLQSPIPVIRGHLIGKDGTEVEFKAVSSVSCSKVREVESPPDRPSLLTTWNEGAKIMTIQERNANADKRIYVAELEQRRKAQANRDSQERRDSRRNYIIGELVAKYFPEVLDFEPGTKDENSVNFEPLEAFLYVLSTDPDMFDGLRKQAAQLMAEAPDGEWRINL